ncbi:MAG TPA: TonB-dependent receptor [Cyclobacteriaceae bacterium]|nr:TonB-dependent receptor [Cyclobacteriaceae bacterium]
MKPGSLQIRRPLLGFVLATMLLVFHQAAAQDRTVSGTVKDEKGEVVPGANIVEKGTNRGTVTDMNGKYTIAAPTGATLLFSFVGYRTTEVVLANQTEINVDLEPDVTSLNEVVVTGYQTQRKSDLTGSVAVVNMSEAKDIPSGSALQNIQGRVPGLYIQSDGSPSGAARSVNIRGVNTLGNTNPLYIIDGVPTTDPNVFQFMDPNSIESMQVLKDASAASIYGSRASNGVIIVTTKQGKDRVSISVNSSLTFANYTRRIPMMNTDEMGRTLWQASVNDGTPTSAHSARYTFEEHTDANGVRVLDRVIPTPFVNGDPNIPSGDTDWQNEVFKTAMISQNNMTITSGGPRSSSLVSLTYFTNSGLVVNNDYQRYNARINNSMNFFEGRLKIGENLQIMKAREHPMGNDQGAVATWNADGTQRAGAVGGATPLVLATTIQPLLPVRKLDGTYAGPIGPGFSDRMNPVFLADLDKDDVNNDMQTFGNIYADVSILDNLVFRTSFGVDYTSNYDLNYEKKFSHGFLNRTINNMSVAQRHKINWTWSNTVNYNLEVGKSRLDLLGGIEAVKNYTQVLSVVKQGYAVEDKEYFQLGSGTGITTANGFATGNQLLSYFGKANYVYDDKYLMSVTVRYDGSSRFGENNKFGLFPAVSLGWTLSNENFIKNNVQAISNLKLRASTGRVGNQEIGDFSRFQQFSTNYGTIDGTSTRATGSAYDISGANTGTLLSGYVATRTANPNLRWETTDEVNVGVDFGFLNQKFTGSFDYFNRNTKDILITPTTVGAIGEGATQTVNGATMANRGFELTFGYHDTRGNFTWSVDGNVSRFMDEITYLPSSVVRSYAGNVEKTILGHSRTAVFGYVADGLFQNAEEVAAHATQPGKGVGRIRYKDLNGDGVIDALDQDWLGTELPGAIYGLNVQVGYKAWSLAIFMRGVANINVNDANKSFTDFLGTNVGVGKGTRLMDAWTPQNPSATIPAVSNVNTNTETRVSTYLRTSGDYFKVQTMQLSYTVPQSFAERLKMTSFRIYGLADNAILIFKKKGENAFTGPDPETPGTIYPRPVRYTFGIDLKF